MFGYIAIYKYTQCCQEIFTIHTIATNDDDDNDIDCDGIGDDFYFIDIVNIQCKHKRIIPPGPPFEIVLRE